MPNKDGSETEQEYYARIRNVPGIFNDRNEGAQAVVTAPDRNLASAEELEKKTILAPAVHPDQERPPVEDTSTDRLPAHIALTQVPGWDPKNAGTAVSVEDPEDAHEVETGTFPHPTESSTNADFPVAKEDGSLVTFQTDEHGETQETVVKPEDNPAVSEEDREALENPDNEGDKDAANQNEEKSEDPQQVEPVQETPSESDDSKETSEEQPKEDDSEEKPADSEKPAEHTEASTEDETKLDDTEYPLEEEK